MENDIPIINYSCYEKTFNLSHQLDNDKLFGQCSILEHKNPPFS